MQPFMTTQQVAEYLNCSAMHVRNLEKAGKLKCLNAGLGTKNRFVRYRRQDVVAFMARRVPRPGKPASRPPSDQDW